jgi:hypothetical protein
MAMQENLAEFALNRSIVGLYSWHTWSNGWALLDSLCTCQQQKFLESRPLSPYLSLLYNSSLGSVKAARSNILGTASKLGWLFWPLSHCKLQLRLHKVYSKKWSLARGQSDRKHLRSSYIFYWMVRCARWCLVHGKSYFFRCGMPLLFFPPPNFNPLGCLKLVQSITLQN